MKPRKGAQEGRSNPEAGAGGQVKPGRGRRRAGETRQGAQEGR